MSLLLDALKKAAEKKAAHGTETSVEASPTSDPTVVLDDTSTTDIVSENTMLDETISDNTENSFLNEETVLEQAELEQPRFDLSDGEGAQVEPGRASATRDGSPGFSDTDFDEDHTLPISEDETVRLSEDVTTFLTDDETVRVSDDETIRFSEDITTSLSDEETIPVRDYEASGTTEDETVQVSAGGLPAGSDDETIRVSDDETVPFLEDVTTSLNDDETIRVSDDETQGITEDETVQVSPVATPAMAEDETTRVSEDETMGASQDETQLDQVVSLTEDDVTEFMGDNEPLRREPELDFNQMDAGSAGLEEDRVVHDLSPSRLPEGATETIVDADETGFLPGAKDDDVDEAETITSDLGRRASSSDNSNGDDTTTRPAVQGRNITGGGLALESLVNDDTLTQQDRTSTHTYAPDNYDRTLHKIDKNDATKIFAGMKAESDVVMTPDYAKKVFLSKSTARRFQHYRVYLGTSLSILLLIFVYGLFEFQGESENIDQSLRPLKRDPLPGVIQSRVKDKSASLFNDLTQTGVDSKTLKLVEAEDQTVEGNGSIVDGLLADAAPVESVAADGVDQQSATSEQQASPEVQTPEAGEAAASQQQVAVGQAKASPAKVTSAKVAPEKTQQSKPQQEIASTSVLQITSERSITEKDELLRDAYAAYQRGEDKSALEKYNQVLAIDAANRNALLARAAIYTQNNNSAAAIDDYRSLLLNNPRDSLAMASLIAVANYAPQDSEAQLKVMIRDDPRSPYLNFALANSYGAQNRWQEAQGHYFSALTYNPDDPNYAYNLAVSMEHIGKPAIAVSYYRRALDNLNKGLATFNKDVVVQRIEILGRL